MTLARIARGEVRQCFSFGQPLYTAANHDNSPAAFAESARGIYDAARLRSTPLSPLAALVEG
jgi:hypothetical protein